MSSRLRVSVTGSARDRLRLHPDGCTDLKNGGELRGLLDDDASINDD